MGLIQRIAKGRLHYGWIVAAVTFLTLLAAAGIRATPSVLMVPLEQEFGWSRATISLAVSVNLLLYGFMGPFSAAISERLGPRLTMSVAMAVLASGVGLTTLMTQSWQLVLLWGVLVGCGSGMVALAIGAAIVNRWFTEQRGLVMGLITASTATGQLVFLPMLAAMVEHFGWRAAVLTVAAAALVAVPLLALLMRDMPSQLGLKPFGQRDAEPERPRSTENPFAAAFGALGEGVRSRDFWLLAGSFFVCGLSTNGLIGTHLIAACFDHGIPEVMAASLLAMMGICDFIGTTGSGWLSDRFNNRYLLCWYYGLRGLSLLFLPWALSTSTVGFGLTAFAIFYGLDWIATVPPTVRLATDIFGKQRGAMIFGWIVAGHQLGAATAAFSAGLLRTYAGDYVDAFVVSGLACLLAAGFVLRIGRGQAGRARTVVSAVAAQA
jgi:sugar phosphate permease